MPDLLDDFQRENSSYKDYLLNWPYRQYLHINLFEILIVSPKFNDNTKPRYMSL